MNNWKGCKTVIANSVSLFKTKISMSMIAIAMPVVLSSQRKIYEEENNNTPSLRNECSDGAFR